MGVLLPTLFCVYLEELLLRLKCSGVGCHIGYFSVPAVSYADDILNGSHYLQLKIYAKYH